MTDRRESMPWFHHRGCPLFTHPSQRAQFGLPAKPDCTCGGIDPDSSESGGSYIVELESMVSLLAGLAHISVEHPGMKPDVHLEPEGWTDCTTGPLCLTAQRLLRSSDRPNVELLHRRLRALHWEGIKDMRSLPEGRREIGTVVWGHVSAQAIGAFLTAFPEYERETNAEDEGFLPLFAGLSELN